MPSSRLGKLRHRQAVLGQYRAGGVQDLGKIRIPAFEKVGFLVFFAAFSISPWAAASAVASSLIDSLLFNFMLLLFSASHPLRHRTGAHQMQA